MIREPLIFEITCLWPRSGRPKLGKRRRLALLPPRCRILLPKLPAKYGLFQPGSGLFSHYFQPSSGFSQAMIRKPLIFEITCLWPRSGRPKLGKRRRLALLPPRCRILFPKLLAKSGFSSRVRAFSAITSSQFGLFSSHHRQTAHFPDNLPLARSVRPKLGER
jgi:hypothetical protein